MKKLLIAVSQDSMLLAKVTSIKKAKDLATLPLDELIVALKDKVTREQTSNDSDSQDGSDEDIDKEEAEAFNMLAKNFRKFFHDDWIVDSGCTKHMIGNRRLFTSYKAYDGRYVVFRSNLKSKVVGRGNITHDCITITNIEHVSGLAFNLISVGFPAQSVGSSNTKVLDSPCLLVLITGMSQSRQHGINGVELMTVGIHDDEASPSRPKRTCQSKTVEEAMLPRDLYDKMGNMEIRQGTLERMTRRQLYHSYRYAELFKHMAGHYGYALQGSYAPPGYDEE
nr:integrase, catalytic region, zinc finger, CCHC-type, peptidase aspartic, catalytic [Tanacetum cinerariifolium]